MNPMYITFAIYLVAVLLIGLAAYFSTRNFDDYILGGRSLGPFVTAMSAGASDMSGWLLMGLPGEIYLYGLNKSWIAIGLVIGAYFNWLLLAGRLRVHTEHANNALTLPDYFFHRFGAGGHLMKVVSALIILFFFTIYCASGIVAGATLFQSLFEGMTYNQAMWLGAGATIAYTFLGGFLAVSWTDTLQASLMIFALILTPVMVYLGLGGAEQMSAAIQSVAASTGKEYNSLFAGTTVIGIISTAAWGLGYFGQPHILARFMADLDGVVSGRRGSGRLFRYCVFWCQSRPNRFHARQPRTYLHRAFYFIVQPLDCRHYFERDFGGGHVHFVLPAFGLLQRDYRRLL